jgi:hypothetical protein
MTVFTKDGLEKAAFTGFTAVADLVIDRCGDVGPGPGVYVVLRVAPSRPRFLSTSVGGWFKGRDPTVDVALLRRRWVEDTHVLYIGKAGTSLRQRVRALVDYGSGRPVGHQGGRYLWQVEGSSSFLIAWKPIADARREEIRLLDEFIGIHGSLPFANITH